MIPFVGHRDARPTLPQLDYAIGLVEKLREAHNIKAETFAHKVHDCGTRLQMSVLITDMRKLVDQIKEADNG